MKRVLSILFALTCVFSLVGCNNSGNSTILNNSTISSDYFESVKNYADDLYSTAEGLTGFSIVGTQSDKDRANYIYEAFKDIGLSNVEKVPVMLNSWEYSPMRILADCNCADNSLITMRLMGTYPTNFNFEDTSLVMHYVGNKSDITPEYISGCAVMLPITDNLESLNNAVKNVSVHNPALIITSSTLTDSTNVYNINTNYMQNIDTPVISIPINSYSLLKNAYDKGVNNGTDMVLELIGSSAVSEELTESYFIQGEIKGKSDKVIYITSHYDSIHNNYMSTCVSTGELLSMAKRLRSEGYKPDYTIRFLATTGQEWGLVDKGQNAGIETFLNSLSDKEKEKIQGVVVLDGSYPVLDSIFTQTSVSEGLFEKVEKYNTDYFAKNNIKFVNTVSVLGEQNDYVTEADIWEANGIPTILTSEIKNSRFVYNNTSADTDSIVINEDLLNYYMNYYIGLVKIMSEK